MQVSICTRPGRVVSLFLLAAMAALCGCDGPAPQADNPPAANNPHVVSTPASRSSATTQARRASAADSGEKPISDAEAQEFAKSLEKAYKSGDQAAIDAAFDYEAILDRAMRGVEADEKARQELIASAKSYLTGADGIAARVVRALAQGEHRRLLHVYRKGEEQRALFRCINQGVTYHDYILHRDASGKVRIADYFDFTDDVLISQEFHQQFIFLSAKASPQIVSHLSPSDREYFAFQSAIRDMRRLVSAKKFGEVMDIYQTFPDVLKEQRVPLRLHLIACRGLDKEFDENLRGYRALRPDDTGVDLISLVYYLDHHRLDDALACIDRLDKVVNGDAYLDGYRSLIYADKGDLALAKKCAQSAAAVEPDNRLSQFCLETVALKEKGGSTKPTAAAKPAAPRGEPAGDEEAKTFAEMFAKAIARADKQTIHTALDTAAIFKRTMDAANMPEEARGGIESQLAIILDPALADFFGFGVPVGEKGSQFHLLRVRRVNGEQHAIFRLVHSNGSVTYYDCTLVRNAYGKVLIDDVYSFEAGTKLSDVVCRIVQFALEKVVPSPQSSGEENSATRLAVAVTEMQQRCKEGQFQAALDIYDKLPESLQKEKAVLLSRIQAASRVKGKPYDEAIRAYRKAFPDEPNLNLLMIDAYLEHKLYDRALACIDGLDKTVGGDPYLDLLRAGVHRVQGDRAVAKKFLTKAIAAEPDLQLPYFGLLSISLEEKKYSDTSRLLTLMQKKFPDRLPAVTSDPAYADYVKSPQYRAWMRTQKR